MFLSFHDLRRHTKSSSSHSPQDPRNHRPPALTKTPETSILPLLQDLQSLETPPSRTMTTETFKSAYGNIPTSNENNYPTWKEKVRQVIMGADAYKVMTREEPEPEGNTREGRTELRNWRKRRNNAPSIIYMGCSDQILPHIKHTIDPAEMWDILHNRFDNMLSKLGRTQILCKFHACHTGKDGKMTTYFTRLIDYDNQLSGSAEEISEESFVTHLCTHIPKEFATTINIFERQAPPPTLQHIMDAIRLDEEKAAFVTEIADASTGDALYSQRRGYQVRGRGRGRGRGGCGRSGRQKTYRCTYCKMDNHTTEACGKRNRSERKWELWGKQQFRWKCQLWRRQCCRKR
jgi:hypothetical protein